MLRASNSALRCLLRNNVRFYRRRRPSTAHITALRGKKLLQNEKTSNLEPNSLGDVENGLKNLKFEELDVEKSLEDVMLGYFERASSTFKRSSTNFKSLQKNLTAEGVTDNEKTNVLFSYLLGETDLEIKRFETMDKEKLRALRESKSEDALNDSIDSEKELERGLVSSLFKPSSENETYLMNLDLVYEILTDLNNKKKPVGARILSVEQLVEAFELAKTVPIQGRRKRGIFLAGNLIYSLGNVRMDPVNESFYIEALVNYGLYRKAYNLFETNREKVDERWWYEMGMMVALRANYLRKFERLLALVDEKFPGYPYISPRILRLAIKKKLLLRDFASANSLTTRLLDIVDTYGLDNDQNNTQKLINFTSENEADLYLNEKELPTGYDLLTVADYHLFKKKFDIAYKVMAKYLDKAGDSELGYQYFVMHLKLNLLRDIEPLKNSLENHMSPRVAEFCLGKLQGTFERIAKDANIDNTTCQDLLFDGVDSLVADPLLTKTVEDLIVSSLRDKNLVSPSKSFHSLLKLLLASGREADAIKVLSNMEHVVEQSAQTECSVDKHFYPKANAHHYGEFIEYYTIKAARSRTKKQVAAWQKKVADTLERMNCLEIPYNAVFLTKLVSFYGQLEDFNNAFALINNIMKERSEQVSGSDTERTSFYNRRLMTKGLYTEIWKACSRYFYLFSQDSHTLKRKSNYRAWNKNVSKIVESTEVFPNFSLRTLLRTMVNDDNILPDESLYFTILVTFMRKKDWEAIPGVLAAMVEVHGISISKKFSDYLKKGIEKEHLLLDRQELNKSVPNGREMALPKGPRASGEVEECEIYDELVQSILVLQKHKHPDDVGFFQVSQALEELQFAPSNMQELINNVHSRDPVM